MSPHVAVLVPAGEVAVGVEVHAVLAGWNCPERALSPKGDGPAVDGG
jgi:hypothetical protein